MRALVLASLFLVACGGRENGDSNVDGGGAPPNDGAADAPNDPARVFVTLEGVAGDAIKGVTDADQRCAADARAAGLEGAFLAWISDATTSPAKRFVHAGPYVRVDGVVVANDWADLTDGRLAAPISVTAGGQALDVIGDPGDAHHEAWTATNPDGTNADPQATCGAWSMRANTVGQVGEIFPSSGAFGAWTVSADHACSEAHHLYCVEQPN